MIVCENRAGYPTGGTMRADRRSRDPLGQRLPGHPNKLSDSELVRLAMAQVATPYGVHTELARADGCALWKGRPDKGHRAHSAEFRQAVQGGTGMPTEAMLGTMRATIQAADRAWAS